MIKLHCPTCEADVPSQITEIKFPSRVNHTASTPRRNRYKCVEGHQWLGEEYTDKGPTILELGLLDDVIRPGKKPQNGETTHAKNHLKKSFRNPT